MQYDVQKKVFTRWNDKEGVPYRSFSLDEYWTHVHPDDLDVTHKLVDYMNGLRTEDYTCDYRYFLSEKNSYIWYFHHVFPYETYKNGKPKSYMGICRENTQWHVMNDNLISFRKRISFASIAAKIHFFQYDVKTDTFFMLDNKGEAADRIIKRATFNDFVYSEDLQIFNDMLDRINNHDEAAINAEYRFRLPEEKEFNWFHSNIFAYSHEKTGEISSYMCISINNNEWHETMKEMMRLSGKAELLKMLSGFLENVGRKIRTPLNAVIGFSDVICDEESEDIKKEYRKIIDENSALLLKISDDVLTLSQIESGNLIFSHVEFDIDRFFREFKTDVNAAKNPDVNLMIESFDERKTVDLDPSMLNRIITTLLNYVASFTQKRIVIINYKIKDNGLYVSVSDPSFTIKKERQKYLFERFENFDRSSKYIPGIGLPVCKAILANDNGKIGVESEPETGTTFWFWVPCKIGDLA